MTGFIAKTTRRLSAALAAAVCALFSLCPAGAASPKAYDIDRAREICDSLPLDAAEGIWLYPDDNVTVLITRSDNVSPTSFREYDISVVSTTDCSVRPGETIGSLTATADASQFVMKLYTERKKDILSRPASCIARLSKNADAFTLKKDKKGIRLRFSLNPMLLLPRTWRIVRISTSTDNRGKEEAPAGMIKIYPSYDGNGSSRRAPRYL